MAKAATLNLDIVAKADKALEAFDKVKEKAKDSSAGMKLAMVGGATAILAALGDATKAAAEHQTEVAKLGQAYKNAGIPTNEMSQSLEEIDKRSRQTGQSAEDNIAAYTTLVTATHSAAKAHTELATAQDLAAFKGISVKDAATAITRANEGNTRALKEMGIATTDAAGKQLPTAQLMAKLTAAVHGQADAYSQTAAGGMARFHESMDQTKVQIGQAMLPALQAVINALQPLLAWLTRNSGVLAKLAPIAAIVAGVILTVVAAIRIWTVVQVVLNAVMSANPIGIVILAIAGLVAAVVLAYTHFKPFRDIVADVWRWIKVLVDFIMAHWKIAIDIMLGPLGVLLTNLDIVKQVIQDIIGALEKVGDAASKALGWLGKIPKGASGIGHALGSLNPFAASATLTGAAPVAITIYATPGDDLPETVYQALRTYQRRHVRAELGPLFAGRGA